VDPKNGTVGFGSGLHGWAFTLKDFAKMYVSKFKIEEPALMKRLWGNQFYHAKEKKWYKEETQGSVRGFTNYILKPIYSVSVATLWAMGVSE
ncbi:elongation factor-2, partial [Plakobranchus ocellatus]